MWTNACQTLRGADAMRAAAGMRLGWAPDWLLLLVGLQPTLLTSPAFSARPV